MYIPCLVTCLTKQINFRASYRITPFSPDLTF